MSEKVREKGRKFARFLQGLPEAERVKGNRIQLQQAEAEHKCFQDNFRSGSCYICDKPLSSFTKESPCLHWLLRPNGFEKNDFLTPTKRYGFFQIQAYLRWVANEEGFARHINDMPEEGTGNKLFENTIRYKNLEWSFSCAESDYLGHSDSNNAKHPHYHFQMRIDNRPFIDYNDFHIPFHEREIISIEAVRASLGLVKQKFFFGEGMRDVLTDETVEHIVNTSIPEGVSENAPFKINTFAIAEEGKKISGDDFYNIIHEAKAKKVTVASLMHKLPSANVRVMVTPGPGVVEQAPRSKRK